MTDPHQARTLLAELDARQDEMLDALANLNEQVEQIIGHLLDERKAELGEPVADDRTAPAGPIPADPDGPTCRWPEAA